MVISAIVLALSLVALDKHLGPDWAEQNAWWLGNRPQGARALLAAIAGSMITVAGVTFSVTISAVAYATSQFGPRLLTNFMQDRGNQITLGTFIAAFIYCLLVLRTVRSAGEMSAVTPAIEDMMQSFVPQTAMLGALGFALASVAVLIYFIHHVPATIHVSAVAARIGQELNAQIKQLCPPLDGDPAAHRAGADIPPPDPRLLRERYRAAAAVRSDKVGYLQHLDGIGLLTVARENDLLLFVARQPGDFVSVRHPLIYAWPAVGLTRQAAGQILGSFAFGNQRTQAQDLVFLAQELVEIAVRALSPGVNDPSTAINCMNWLGSALSTLVTRQTPPAYRYDDEGKLRVVYQPLTFVQFLDTLCDDLRPHVKRDRSAALHLFDVLSGIAPDVIDKNHRSALIRQAELLNSGCEQALDQHEDRAVIAGRCSEVVARIRDPGTRPDVRLPSHVGS
jgi:uncharacterized membrane protein